MVFLVVLVVAVVVVVLVMRAASARVGPDGAWAPRARRVVPVRSARPVPWRRTTTRSSCASSSGAPAGTTARPNG